MSRAIILKLALPIAAVLSTLPWSSPGSVGPPWISIEMPANPMDLSTRGSAIVVHTFHHEHPAGFPIIGTAEGLVNGQRRSIDLEFRETSKGGVFAVDQQWPAEGHWILTFTTGAHADVSLVVELGPDGGVNAERFYDWSVNSIALRSTVVVQGEVDLGRIDAALQAMAAGD